MKRKSSLVGSVALGTGEVGCAGARLGMAGEEGWAKDEN
jgi:hypothetical protein